MLNHKSIHHNKLTKPTHINSSGNRISPNSILNRNKLVNVEIGKQQKLYYWIWAESSTSGRQVIYGCKNTMEEAKAVVNKIHNAECQITPLSTRNGDQAAPRLRAIMLGDTGNIDESFKHFIHLENKNSI